MHQYGAEVLEYIYSLSGETDRRAMVAGLYGNYYLLIKEFFAGGEDKKVTNELTLEDFLKKKPHLATGFLEKMEPLVMKLVHKGLTRHTIS